MASAWALLVALADAGAQAAPAPLAPLEQRLGEGWRWRSIDGPESESVFITVCPWTDGGLIAMDERGLLAFDGFEWKRKPGWEGFAGPPLTGAVRTNDGLIAITGSSIVSIDAAGERKVLLEVTNPSKLTRPCRMADGSVLVGVEHRILRIDASGMHELIPAPDGATMLSGLVCDPEQHLWICTDSGLFRRVDERWEPVPWPASTPRGTPRLAYGLASANEVHFLPSVMDNRLRGFTWDGSSVTDFYDRGRPIVVSDATATPGGELVIALRDPILRVFREGKWRDVALPQDRREYVRSLCLTSDGRLAVVFGAGGLAVCDLGARCWQQFDPSPAGVSPVVNAIAPAVAGGVWVGTQAGIARWDGSAFTDVHAAMDGLGVPLEEVTAVCEDGQGRLWVGSGSGFHGAACLQGGRWTLHAKDSPIGLSHVHRIVRDGDDLWFMLLSDDPEDWQAGGLARLRDGTFTAWRTSAQGEPLPRCYDIARTGDGALVACTLRRLYRFDAEAWQPLASPFDALPRAAWAMHSTRDGTLLVGAGLVEPGVQRLRDGSWKAIVSSDGRRAAGASFCETNDGKLWFASSLGLFLLDGDECHDVSTLLPERNIWPLLADTANGGMWLGMLGGGLAHFHPGDTGRPRTLDFHVGLTPDGLTTVSWRSVDAWNTTPPAQMRCRARIDGRPITWSPRGRVTPTGVWQTTFTDIETGEHELVVESIDCLGNVEEHPASITFPVKPPLLRSTPMLVAMAAVLGGAAWMVTLMVKRRRERHHAQLSHAELAQRLSELTLQLLSTQEDERRKLSRELHDNLGQICTALCIDIQRAARMQDEGKRSSVLDHALGAARDMLEKVRRMSFDLRPLLLDDHGLPKAVVAALTDFTTVTGIDVQSNLDFSGSELPQEVSGHVYRILQEALTNVARHAHAQTVDIRLHTSEERIELTVADDGTGFVPNELPHKHGFGLLGMRERAELMGGSFVIQSSPHAGTTIRVSIPVRRSRAKGGRDSHSGSDRHG